jgi:segregation and condensation protein B
LPSLRSRLEALLFVASEPATLKELCAATEAAPEAIKAALKDLAEFMKDRGMTLREVGGGWRLTANPACRADVERFLLPPKNHLSPAALETLAIVAYRQPVSRVQIGALRGVNVDGVVRLLEQRGYIEAKGHADGPGQAVLFGTTELFLDRLGLRSLDELPPIAQFLEGLEEARALAGELAER